MCKFVKIVGYAADMNVLGRSRMSVNEVRKALENQTVAMGLNTNTDETKAVIQTRKEMRGKVIHFK